jgi:hypothetical protein
MSGITASFTFGKLPGKRESNQAAGFPFAGMTCAPAGWPVFGGGHEVKACRGGNAALTRES